MLRVAVACRMRCVALLMVVALTGCERSEVDRSRFVRVEGGDPDRGQRLLERYQCGSCHVIPDVPAAVGRRGPSLARFEQRSYIAGKLPNLPPTLVRWIRDPQALLPGTPMPNMGATEADARDMAAFLLAER